MLENETTAQADVVFPLESHAEKDGTVTHPDGRLQRVRPSAARPGDVRPGWQVLAELAAALGPRDRDRLGARRPAAVAERFPSTPASPTTRSAAGGFAGRSARRPLHSPAVHLRARSPDLDSRPRRTPARQRISAWARRGHPTALLQLGTYRDLWAGPVTELNPALRFLKPAQRVELSHGDAERLGIGDGDQVTVGRTGRASRRGSLFGSGCVDGACFLIEGTAEGNANALLNGGHEVVRSRRWADDAAARRHRASPRRPGSWSSSRS